MNPDDQEARLATHIAELKARILDGLAETIKGRLEKAISAPDAPGPAKSSAGLPLQHPKMERYRRFSTHGWVNKYDPLIQHPGGRPANRRGQNRVARRAQRMDRGKLLVILDHPSKLAELVSANRHPKHHASGAGTRGGRPPRSATLMRCKSTRWRLRHKYPDAPQMGRPTRVWNRGKRHKGR